MRSLLNPVILISVLTLPPFDALAGTDKAVGMRIPSFLMDTALTEYAYTFSSDISDHERRLHDTPDAEGPFRVRDGLMKIRGYDDLAGRGNRRREGDVDTPVLGTVHLVREERGDTVHFTETGEMRLEGSAGDIVLASLQTGKLILSESALTIETRIVKDGKLAAKTFLESIRLANNVWLVQFLFTVDPDAMEEQKKAVWLAGCFLRFDRSGYRRVEVNNPSQLDFSPLSLRGRGDISPDAMAGGYAVTKTVTIADGIVIVE